MAGVKEGDLRSFNGWPAGIDNLNTEEAMPSGRLREADNVNLDRAGKPSRRDGYTPTVSGTNTHSAWSDDRLPWGLFVSDGSLCVLHSDASSDVLVTGLPPGRPVSYVLINDAVRWTNGVQSGMVTLDLETDTWATPGPAGQPQLLAVSGALDKGAYQIAVTFVDVNGRESGTGRAAAIEVGDGAGIQLLDIPQPADPVAVPRIRVYATTGNDSVLRLAVALPAGTTQWLFGQKASASKKLNTQLLTVMPPGQIVTYGNGKQYVARGNELLHSPSMRYGLFAPAKARISFAGRIDMAQFMGDGTDGAGLFLADAHRTYWLAGADPKDWRQVIAYPHGVVPGSATLITSDVLGFDGNQTVVVWYARNGLWCVGSPGGSVTALKLAAAVGDQAESAAVMVREHKGIRQIVTALRGCQPQGLAVRDQMIVREYRQGTDTP